MSYMVIAGVAVVCATLLVIGLSVKSENGTYLFFVKNFFILSTIVMLSIIPNTMLVTKECAPVVNSSVATTISSTQTQMTYTYVDFCYTYSEAGTFGFQNAYRVITYVFLSITGLFVIINTLLYLTKKRFELL